MIVKKGKADQAKLEDALRNQSREESNNSEGVRIVLDTPNTATGRMTHHKATLVEEITIKDQMIKDLEEKMMASNGKRELISTDLIDPESYYHNRSESMMGSPENLELYESIAENGNIVPILVRVHADKDSQYKYQIIAGHCRFEGCRRHGRDISVIVTNVDDRDLIVYRLSENIKRSNPAPFDTGVLIDMAMEQGVFASQEEFSKKANLHKTVVSRYRSIASFRKPENTTMYAIYMSFDDFVPAMTVKKFIAISSILKKPGEASYLSENLKALDKFTISDPQRMEIYTDFRLFNYVIDIIDLNEEITEYSEVIKLARKALSDEDLDIALENKKSEDLAEKGLMEEVKSRKSRTIFKEHVFGDIKLKIGVRKNDDGTETIQGLQFDHSNQKQAKYIVDKLQELMSDFEKLDGDLFKTAD
jgi:ParB/RepB/Spo0J family partition protein